MYSLSASKVDGRGSIGNEPCFATISAGVYGRFKEENRGELKNDAMSEHLASNCSVSCSTEGGWRGNCVLIELKFRARGLRCSLHLGRADLSADIVGRT